MSDEEHPDPADPASALPAPPRPAPFSAREALRARRVAVVGAGLAGCEVALQLADRGVQVTLLEMKPRKRTPAQSGDDFAELVCSNSLRSDDPLNAIGLLKWEMRAAGSHVMAAADLHAVPAGSALAVDRDLFSAELTRRARAHPQIEVREEVVEALPPPALGYDAVVVCTGPLTDEALAADVARFAGRESLYFYDAIAPIIDADSINWDIVWRQSRYDKGDADYANVPLSEEQYRAFVQALVDGEKVKPREFEEARYFEGCLPVEVMAERGPETLAFGPLKPVGLTPPSGARPYAVAQLRMENREGTAWNMVGFQTRLKYPEQLRVFRALPGLERAEFLRFGSIHRNTYLHAPTVLAPDLRAAARPDLYFAGQITGVEGYVESAACGLLVAWHVLAHLQGAALPLPGGTTAFGALYRHLRHEGIYSDYTPSNINWSFFDPMPRAHRREKKHEKRARMAARAMGDFVGWWGARADLIG
ncbi:MAG: methylenetetrahydrofolate--tRNA-(uracil(54)-C(5))-methyltransferase (FADH(2)-oxidizing) TrmFO [Deltaproteobacteria bacterium]|nr:methylenetetrahydrofolate--tRNA-(uracil(54)-C(5))-methyltransferase (FADH(2)-oxidizing) TrmFO [Deltaproteobacteria bacterium]